MTDLVDIGANLTHDSFDADRDEVIDSAAACGVTRLIVTGSTVEGSRQAAALAETRPGALFATAGVHPHHAADWDEGAADALRPLFRHPSVVAVGECGLDYFRNFSPREAQRAAFQAQLELAAECGLPVFLHQRDAHDDFLEVLRPMTGRLNGGVAHCFTGDARMLRDYLDLGLYIGITGWICDERRGRHLLELVRDIPRERLLLETDSPYLTPRDLRPQPAGRRNEPALLPHVARAVARALGRPVEELAAQTTRNAVELFGLHEPSAPAPQKRPLAA